MSCGSKGRKAAFCAARTGLSRGGSLTAYHYRAAATTTRHNPGIFAGTIAGNVIGLAVGQAGGAGNLRHIAGGVLGGLAGAAGGALVDRRLRAHARRQAERRQQLAQLTGETTETAQVGPGGALYDSQKLNFRAGAELTQTFSGATASVKSLLSAVGDRQAAGQMRPLLKLGGEDDLFVAEGARGQIAFSLPDGPQGDAKIEGALPARGQEQELAGALDGRLPKYIITDEESGDQYATRNPYEARQFSNALNQVPEDAVYEVHPGETEFDESYKPVPEALFY